MHSPSSARPYARRWGPSTRRLRACDADTSPSAGVERELVLDLPPEPVAQPGVKAVRVVGEGQVEVRMADGAVLEVEAAELECESEGDALLIRARDGKIVDAARKTELRSERLELRASGGQADLRLEGAVEMKLQLGR